MGKRRSKPSFFGLAGFMGALNQDSTPNSQKSQDNESGQPSKKLKTNDGASVVTAENEVDSNPPQGKEIVKRDTDGSLWITQYDATGLVPHYSDEVQVPEYLKKYYGQRYRMFSLYSEYPGCLLDEEGWYSVTPERIADQIAERCRCDTILDPFCGVGGNAIAFAKTCQRVIALDTSPTRLKLARHNAQIYGVADRIEFILCDYLTFAESYLKLHPEDTSNSNPRGSPNHSTRKIDIVFLSPPWGGPTYLHGSDSNQPIPATSVPSCTDAEGDDEAPHPTFSLSSIQPIHGAELFKLTRQITRNIAYYLPRNTSLEEISQLLPPSKTLQKQNNQKDKQQVKGEKQADTVDSQSREMIEIEEEWMGSKLKALTCYFGGLADGQAELY